MTSVQNALCVLATLITGGGFAEFVADNQGYTTASGCLAFTMLVVYCVQRSNRKR